MGGAAVRILDKNQLSLINSNVYRILGEIGIKVDDSNTEKRLLEKGCVGSRTGRLLFPSDIVNRALETVPHQMVIYDREGRPAVFSSGKPSLCIGLNCMNIYDRKLKESRPGLLKDIRDAAKICSALDGISMAAPLCTPSDVSPTRQAPEAVRAVIEETSKPVAFTAHSDNEAEIIWEHLASESGGWTRFLSKPSGLDLTGPTSPLFIGKEAVRRLCYAAARNLPVVCYPGIIPGASSPVTLSGAVAQSSAEILAGIVIHQMENPGAPVLSGSAVLPMDMRRGVITYGSAEYALACGAAVDYFNMLGVPVWSGGGCSDAPGPGSRAAAEAMLTMNMAVMSETSFIHNAGYLSSGKTGSLEMIVFAEELFNICCRLKQGMDCTNDSIGFDLIESASKDGDYMGSEHTVSRMRTEMIYPAFFPRRGGNSEPDIWEMVTKRVESILSGEKDQIP